MKDVLFKMLICIFSLIFGIRVFTIFLVDRLYSMSLSAERSGYPGSREICLLDAAAKLDPSNADLYFKKYEILGLKEKAGGRNPERLKRRLEALRKCIQLCPSKPSFHLHYAYLFKRMFATPNLQTEQLIISEIKKARDLKPYSELYRKIYEKHLNKT